MEGNAQIGTTGKPEPELLADLDGERVGRAIPLEVGRRSSRRQHRESSVNWCGVGSPNEGWARQVFGEPDVERLWELVAFCFRLDEPDPVAAWREHLARLDARAARSRSLRPDAIRYRGPGTDLTVGLLADRALGQRALPHGLRHRLRREHADRGDLHDSRPGRAEGTIRSSMPLSLGGQLIRGLEFTFEDGRIVDVDAETGADLVRSHLATIENADRLGELALVTKESRVGQTGTLFYNTLFDENATCHIAYGFGFRMRSRESPTSG